MKVEYSTPFQEFVRKCTKENTLVGSGNPNASILLVGKEAAIAPESLEDQHWYVSNAQIWNDHISNGTSDHLEYDVDKNHGLRKGWGRNTWSKYQKLVDLVFKRDSPKFHVNFLRDAFTTEINDAPSKQTSSASKDGLQKRKALFKESDFLRDFPVVVLACSNYIKNIPGTWEINDIFQVKYDGHDLKKYHYSPGNTFWTHSSGNKQRLVIHTRQLSANVNNALLTDMAQIIREHLKRVNPEIFSKEN